MTQRYLAESHTISLMKSISWRIVGTLTTFSVTFTITDSVGYAAAVGGIELVAKIFLFYLHERIWIKIHALRNTGIFMRWRVGKKYDL